MFIFGAKLARGSASSSKAFQCSPWTVDLGVLILKYIEMK